MVQKVTLQDFSSWSSCLKTWGMGAFERCKLTLSYERKFLETYWLELQISMAQLYRWKGWLYYVMFVYWCPWVSSKHDISGSSRTSLLTIMSVSHCQFSMHPVYHSCSRRFMEMKFRSSSSLCLSCIGFMPLKNDATGENNGILFFLFSFRFFFL